MIKELSLQCESKIFVTEASKDNQTTPGAIEARATTWGAREGEDGRKFFYKPEGFSEWADKFSKEGKPMPMFLNHNDMGAPIGQWEEVSFDDEGMTAKGKLFLETSGGADIYHILKESPDLFGGVSVGAYAEEAQMVDKDGNPIDDDTPLGEAFDGYFQITKGGLRELSVVMYPNNKEAQVINLESIEYEGGLNLREIEKTLREAGFSHKDATTASLAMKKRFKVGTTPQNLPTQQEADAVETQANELLHALTMRELSNALSKRIK